MKSFSDYRSRVAVYLRKSRMDSDAESVDETLARHAETLAELAERLGLNIVKIYKEVVSGDGLFTRPEMIRLLNDIENGCYSAVCCMDIDRLGRSSQKDGGIILETLQEHDVFIITPSKTYNLNDELDEQSVEMQSFIARQELKSIKRRLRRGLNKTLENGGHIAEPPFGYRRAYLGKKPTLEICEDEADIIRSVFDMYVNQGLGSQTIAEHLNAAGLRPRKNDHFSRTTIQFYLKNPIYTGKIVWNRKHRVKKKTYTDKNRYIPNPECDWITSEGLHPAIITQELFDEAQRICESRSHPPTCQDEIKNPFAGLIRCQNCGRIMQRQCGKHGGSRLLCVNKGCNRSIKTEHIENVVFDALRDILSNAKYDVFAKSESVNAERAEVIRRLISGMQKELKQLNSQKNSLHDFLEKGVYDIPTFLERSQSIEKRTASCEAEIAKAQSALVSLTIPRANDAAPTTEYLLNCYSILSPAEKNIILKTLIKSMSYLRTPQHIGSSFDLSINWRYEI